MSAPPTRLEGFNPHTLDAFAALRMRVLPMAHDAGVPVNCYPSGSAAPHLPRLLHGVSFSLWPTPPECRPAATSTSKVINTPLIPTLRCGTLLLASLATQVPCLAQSASPASTSHASPLAFDAAKFAVKKLSVDGRSVSYRAYEGLVTVANPVDARYQSLNFYVPVEYYEGKTVGGYTADSAPIFFPNTVGGYMPGLAGSPAIGSGPGLPGGPGPGMPPRQLPAGVPPHELSAGGPPGMTAGPDLDAKPNAMALALSKGYVVAAPGARGRTLKDSAGNYTGKAPACIVDLKAAVRYLRLNDALMPGDAEKIISNGTSAGGALSALLGATGNAADYTPYLKALGAADTRDDIFAASCYCPITNLDNADAAYEWLFNGLNTYSGRGVQGELSPDRIDLSRKLKALFPAYVNSLALHAPDGTPLTLTPEGTGPFADYVKALVLASAQAALASGATLTGNEGITVKDGTATTVDLAKFAAFITRMKATPAFDDTTLATGENNLFGTAAVDRQHFTRFAADHSTDHTLADAAVVRTMNPLNHLGQPGVTTARHWRLRHGTIDRDTSLAIPAILALRLQNTGSQVDLAFPWGVGHAGDYDLAELFAWMERISR